MRPTSDDMNDRVLERLAKLLWRCPFDRELFDSSSGLRLHLVESHAREICGRRRVTQQAALGDVERPTKLTFCGHCLGCMVPDAPDRNAISEIGRHIREQHPNPSGPTVVTLKVTTDPTLIQKFIEEQTWPEVCACSAAECGELFSNEDLAAGHWIEMHCPNATAEEAGHLVETDPERFNAALEQSLADELAEKPPPQSSPPEPDDGYVISHCPSVPRVRSKPSECIVYIEREKVRFFNDELEQLLDCEGLGSECEESPNEIWSQDRRQTIQIELRFCNILDGYIPMVGEVRSILPPLPDGGMIDVSWQDEPETWFQCKVSKPQTKRAIYNLEGRLKEIFGNLDSGVRLYITRAGVRQYHLHLKRQQHIVRNCKFFLPKGECGWHVEVRNQDVEWETGDEVFRHQLTFKQMEALREEARRTNLSVKDAVYETMKQMAQGRSVHVRDVYEAVFLQMRTCSLAAVWAQFRPEHECYVRVEPGYYRFDASKPLPAVRFRSPEPHNLSGGSSSRNEAGHAPASRIRILVRWSKILNMPCPDEHLADRTAGATQARFVGSLIREFPELANRLTKLPVSRAYPLSDNPRVDFFNAVGGKVYSHKLVPGTDGLYLFTTTENSEKRDDILQLVERLGFPSRSVEVFIIPGLSKANLLASL